jgi:hypothetical protein
MSNFQVKFSLIFSRPENSSGSHQTSPHIAKSIDKPPIAKENSPVASETEATDDSSAVMRTVTPTAATVANPTPLVTSQSIIQPSSSTTTCVHPSSSSIKAPIDSSSATAEPVGASTASSETTSLKATSSPSAETQKTNSDASALDQFFQKILMQCSEGQIGLKTAIEVTSVIPGVIFNLFF